VARRRPTAFDVEPSLTCLDGGRPDAHTTPLTPLHPSQRVVAELEMITVAVRLLFETVEERLTAVEDRADALGQDCGAVRVSLTRIESKVDALTSLQETIEARLDALRARQRSSVPCPLSPREVEVLMRLAEGEVYKQIAHGLSLSTSTVRTHLHNIYGKLGAVDRAQAVLLASERGWL
jgi:DNA-binding NarL/FixJ family response regulator